VTEYLLLAANFRQVTRTTHCRPAASPALPLGMLHDRKLTNVLRHLDDMRNLLGPTPPSIRSGQPWLVKWNPLVSIKRAAMLFVIYCYLQYLCCHFYATVCIWTLIHISVYKITVICMCDSIIWYPLNLLKQWNVNELKQTAFVCCMHPQAYAVLRCTALQRVSKKKYRFVKRDYVNILFHIYAQSVQI